MTSEKERARRIILKHGWAASSYQLLNPGITYWFSGGGEALVGYVRKAGVRVVAGAPVAAREDLADVARAFEEDASAAGDTVCYFCSEARLADLYQNHPGYGKLILGGQPVWNPQGWEEIIHSGRSVRAQLNRARNKNVTVEAWSSERAHRHPDLEELLEGWLDHKALPSMHFLVEPRTLSQVRDRQVFVGRNNGCIVGFLVASPVPCRRGWLVEQIIRHPSAPNGTSELMVHTAARFAARQGSTYFTLGLAPLAERFMREQAIRPRWLQWTLQWMRSYGQRFYNFAGLEYFKSKFQPHYWEPVYAIVNEEMFSVQSVYAIASAFSDRSPVGLVARSVHHVVVEQLKQSWERIPSPGA